MFLVLCQEEQFLLEKIALKIDMCSTLRLKNDYGKDITATNGSGKTISSSASSLKSSGRVKRNKCSLILFIGQKHKYELEFENCISY